MTRRLLLWLCSIACLVCSWPWPSSAEAQLRRGDFRLSLDTDVISVAHVTIDPDGPLGEYDRTVFGIGPNQLGGSHVTQPASPLGLGFGWVLMPKLVLGLRLGLGFDVISADGDAADRKVLAISLMPGLTFVPIGRRAKLFIALSPLFQVNRIKLNNYVDRWLQGGFSAGIGTLIFPASPVSVDLGFFFEGRFGNRRIEEGGEDNVREHVADLRGVVRLGISLWR